ncbi:AAA family ATPase [Paenibacillus piri]|uniref:ParA family protein n=1 Tax=Paenibacillus piri TaxID=2547395 RepID=A0A4R5KX15_9BACL|nr:AAA family ATPase [Paenibacillus piri]TDF99587.1 ParA family protein [Paenibacillus piri]
MAKMKLVLLEQDSYFIDMLSSYIRTSEHADTFTISVFTSKEQGFSFVERSREPYILLVHERFIPLPEHVFQRQLGCLILLSDAPSAADIMEYPVLCKYRPLNQLLSHIISHFNEYASNRMLKGSRSSRVISVYSAVGGSGKTLTAVHLARELADQGKRVFYLNLEQLPSAAWLEAEPEEEDNYFSRMLYYGKTDMKLQTAKVERYKRRHRIMGFDYFPGVSAAVEMSEITEHDTESLIQSVLASGGYDCLLLDLDSPLYPRVTASLKQSDQVLWLVIDDRVHLEKTKLLLSQLAGLEGMQDSGLNGKLRFVVNKYGGSLSSGLAAQQLPVAGYLPYVPEWKAVGSLETLQARGAFSESVGAITGIYSPDEARQADVVR